MARRRAPAPWSRGTSRPASSPSASSAVSLVDGFRDALAAVGMERETAQGTALVVVTIILALFTIVFAELVPKTLALAHPERWALALSRPIDFLARILSPIISLLTGITRWVARLLGVQLNQE